MSPPPRTFPHIPPHALPRKKFPLEFLSLFVEAQEGTLIPLMHNRPTHTSVPTRSVGCSFGGWSPAPACSFEAGGLE